VARTSYDAFLVFFFDTQNVPSGLPVYLFCPSTAYSLIILAVNVSATSGSA